MRSQECKQIVTIIVIAVILAATVVYAATHEGAHQPGKQQESISIEPRIAPEPPVPPPPPSDKRFTASIWTDQPSYNIGDLIRINFRVSRPCYVYIFDTDTRGVTRQLFPNYYDSDNSVFPGGRYILPDQNYRLRVTGPPGTEELHLVAVRYRPVYYDRQHRFNPQEPFPTYSEGSQGFLREYQRQEKGPAAPLKKGDIKVQREAKEPTKGAAITRRAESVEVTQSVETPDSAQPESSTRRAESIAIEPAPRPIVVEPGVSYDRDYAEAFTLIQVVDPNYVPPAQQAYGQMTVNSVPGGARTIVDGVLRGYTPVTVRYLPIGPHRVQVSMPGFYTFDQDIEVIEGRTATVNVRLQPQRSRWSFGFGVSP